MTYVKINDTLYQAAISGKYSDPEWDGRSSKTILLAMTHSDAVSTFVDNVQWSIIDESLDAQQQPVQVEYDNSEYSMAGDVVDHRNGTVSVKMGKPTDAELLAIIMGR